MHLLEVPDLKAPLCVLTDWNSANYLQAMARVWHESQQKKWLKRDSTTKSSLVCVCRLEPSQRSAGHGACVAGGPAQESVHIPDADHWVVGGEGGITIAVT